ncbi:MAG: DivIVA domain-containing protein [Desulfobacterales bacterium]|nr:DivIVA domain-containing protein [Desulfobacterales bacterium]
MELTPEDIRVQQFKLKFRGFDIQEVDSFLEHVSSGYEKLLNQQKTLIDKVNRLEVECDGHKKREELFKKAVLNSQKVLEEMKANARKSAELIIAEAEVKAEKILNGAHSRLSQLYEDISELKRQRMQIEVQLRAIIESHSKLLDMSKEESKEAEEQNFKIKVFNK